MHEVISMTGLLLESISFKKKRKTRQTYSDSILFSLALNQQVLMRKYASPFVWLRPLYLRDGSAAVPINVSRDRIPDTL